MDDQERRVLRLLAALVLLAVLGTGFAGGAPIADDPNAASGATVGDNASGFQGVTVEGDGYVTGQEELVADHPGPAYVWATEPLTVNATLGSGVTDEYAVCAEATGTDGEVLSDLGCQSATADEGGVTFDIGGWPEEYQGRVWITLELRTEAGEMEYYETVPVTVIHPEGDLSGDGLTNAEEVRYGTDFTVPDTTGNGLTDWEEVRVHGTDPLATDTSGDGISDATAVRLGLDPTIPYLPYVYVGGGLLVAVLVVAGGVALGWHLIHRYADGAPVTPAEPSGSTAPDDTSPESPPDPAPAEPASTPESDEEGPPLTKEEEIRRILREHDGRLKQSRLVEHTEWSQATVSRVLSNLEQEGAVTKIRSGRENIVELRDVDADSSDA